MAQLHLLQQLVAQASAGLPAQPPPALQAPAAVPASSAFCPAAGAYIRAFFLASSSRLVAQAVAAVCKKLAPRQLSYMWQDDHTHSAGCPGGGGASLMSPDCGCSLQMQASCRSRTCWQCWRSRGRRCRGWCLRQGSLLPPHSCPPAQLPLRAGSPRTCQRQMPCKAAHLLSPARRRHAVCCCCRPATLAYMAALHGRAGGR